MLTTMAWACAPQQVAVEEACQELSAQHCVICSFVRDRAASFPRWAVCGL